MGNSHAQIFSAASNVYGCTMSIELTRKPMHSTYVSTMIIHMRAEVNDDAFDVY